VAGRTLTIKPYFIYQNVLPQNADALIQAMLIMALILMPLWMAKLGYRFITSMQARITSPLPWQFFQLDRQIKTANSDWMTLTSAVQKIKFK
jgi:hypothetical protein